MSRFQWHGGVLEDGFLRLEKILHGFSISCAMGCVCSEQYNNSNLHSGHGSMRGSRVSTVLQVKRNNTQKLAHYLQCNRQKERESRGHFH